MRVTFVIQNSHTNHRRVHVTRTAVIGRAEGCGLRIASTKVSRRHCEVILSGGEVRVRDLGSSNGTFVNGNEVGEDNAVLLRPGDELMIGSVRMVAEYDAPSLPLDAAPNAVADERESVGDLVDAAEPDDTASEPRTAASNAFAALVAEASAEAEKSDSAGDAFDALVSEAISEGEASIEDSVSEGDSEDLFAAAVAEAMAEDERPAVQMEIDIDDRPDAPDGQIEIDISDVEDSDDTAAGVELPPSSQKTQKVDDFGATMDVQLASAPEDEDVEVTLKQSAASDDTKDDEEAVDDDAVLDFLNSLD